MASQRGISADRRLGTDGSASQALLAMGRFFTRWDETLDDRAVFRAGGRAGDVFYRDRWSHDKVVRSTHGVNCTGSCSQGLGKVGSCRSDEVEGPVWVAAVMS